MIPAGLSGPLRRDIEIGAPSSDSDDGPAVGSLSLRLRDATGEPVSLARIEAEATDGVLVDAVRETERRGVHTATLRWPARVRACRVRFTINEALRFEQDARAERVRVVTRPGRPPRHDPPTACTSTRSAWPRRRTRRRSAPRSRGVITSLPALAAGRDTPTCTRARLGGLITTPSASSASLDAREKSGAVGESLHRSLPWLTFALAGACSPQGPWCIRSPRGDGGGGCIDTGLRVDVRPGVDSTAPVDMPMVACTDTDRDGLSDEHGGSASRDTEQRRHARLHGHRLGQRRLPEA